MLLTHRVKHKMTFHRFIHITLLLILLSTGIALFAPSIHAQRPDAPRYGNTGSYAVGTLETVIPGNDHPLTVTIWYPADATPGAEPAIQYDAGLGGLLQATGNAYRNSAPFTDDAPYPLVIFSHGNGGSRVLSLALTEHLASYGFVVMAANHPRNNVRQTAAGDAQDFVRSYALRPDDIVRQIDHAENVLNASGGALEGIIDTDNIAVTGHSFGGLTALLSAGGRLDFSQLDNFCETINNPELEDGVCFLVSEQDEIAAARNYNAPESGPWESIDDSRIQAVAAFAPWNGPILDVAQINVPTLIIVGTSDETTPPERDAYDMYERLSSPRYLLELRYAGHNIFLDSCSSFLRNGFFDICSDKVWDMQRAHDIVNHTTVAFLLTHLKNDSEAAAYLQEERLDFRATEFSRDVPADTATDNTNDQRTGKQG
jgi:predicted dienelactone hydrolase